MAETPLFFSPPVHEKLAGYKLPPDPKLWQSEIIRYLKSQHPYLPLESAEIDLRRMDAANGAAVGSVILDSKIAIPIVIKRPRPGSDPELSPLDVFFQDGRYRFLDPESIKNVIQSPQIGVPETSSESRVTGGNPYIGDVTGDATPLEYSGQASPFAGPFDGSKISADISAQLLPEYMLAKTAKDKPLGQEMKDKATLFGLTSGTGAAIKQLVDPRLGSSRLRGLPRAVAVGLAAGTAGGAVTPAILRAVGMKKKLEKEERQKIQDVVRTELKKKAAWRPEDFTAGAESVVDRGLTARLTKTAYMDPNDLSNFRALMATNPHALQGLGHNLGLVELLSRRGPNSVGIGSSVEKYPNVLQVYERDGAVYIKFSGGPEAQTTGPELKRILRDRYPEAMSKIRSGRVFMTHEGVNQVTWDVDRPVSRAQLVTRDGLYALRSGDGENLVGLVCRAVMDLDGKTLPLSLFVTPEGKYALAGEMFGVRLAGKHRLMSRVPQGGTTGVWVNYVHGTPVATVPMFLMDVRRMTTEAGEQRTLYRMRNPVTGERFTLSPVTGVQGLELMHVVDPTTRALAQSPIYYMPGDSEWVELRNPVRLAESAEELRKLGSLTHVTYTGGQWNVVAEDLDKVAGIWGSVAGGARAAGQYLGRGARAAGGYLGSGAQQLGGAMADPRAFGQGVKKVYQGAGGGLGGVWGAAKHLAPAAATVGAIGGAGAMLGRATGPKQASFENLDAPEAREILAAMGMPADDIESVLDRVRTREGMDRGLKIAGLHAPRLQGHEVIETPSPIYDQATVDFALGCRPSIELLKAAAESGHPETLDALLSLEFITPQNLRYFVDAIPDLEEVAAKLAALLVAVRLGMPHVAEAPVKDALEGLSKTVNKLVILRSAIGHENERAAGA